MRREQEFNCMIEDMFAGQTFHARVVVAKKTIAEVSRWNNRVTIADIFIFPIVGGGGDIHDHFVLFDITGHGLHIARDQTRRDFIRRECTLWDLGQDFARKVMAALQEM